MLLFALTLRIIPLDFGNVMKTQNDAKTTTMAKIIYGGVRNSAVASKNQGGKK